MPQGKNASYRYRLIDHALRNTGRTWSIEDLLDHLCDKLEEEFDVNLNKNKARALSIRQLLDDIRIMRKDPPQGYGAPIVRKDGYIFYEDPSFSINDNPLNNADVESLNEVLRLIKPFQSLPHLRELESILGKVKGTLSQNMGEQIIQMDHIPDAKGLHHLEKLYEVIKEEQIVEIQYRPFTFDEDINVVLHPYLIKEYNNRWFLLGWNPGENRFSVHGLDRIVGFSKTENQIDRTRKHEMLELQRMIIGVSFPDGGSPQEIKLWATARQLQYLITKPIHHSQRIIEMDDSGGILSLNLVPNFELEQTILMFGENVKVVEPSELGAKIKGRIKQSLSNYE
jgi:predicted DNA-binding transcriptional regulator YafY